MNAAGEGTHEAVVHPCDRPQGECTVPGDKSVSHRAVLLAALSRGESCVEGFLRSEDCLNTLRAMERIGAGVRWEADRLHVTGTSGRFRAPDGVLDAGNSGTGMRLMAGLLAGQPFVSEITGDKSLCSRPMTRIRDPLERMGAQVELLGPKGCAPIRIHGGRLRGIDYASPVASAQVKSCTLLAGLFAEGPTRVTEPKPTRDHTERMFCDAGIPVRVQGLTVEIPGFGPQGPCPAGRHWVVPGDISSAAFGLVAAAIAPGSEVVIRKVGLNPRRTAVLDVLRRMGADVAITPAGQPGGEPYGDVCVRGGSLRGTEIFGEEIPNLIDEIPVLAVAAVFAEGTTTIRDARELRVKESDRIRTMVGNLRALGAAIEETEDGMIVRGPCRLRGGIRLDSFGDHRVAMSMAVAALRADRPVTITDIACVPTSYPGFWDDLRRLGAHVA